MADVPQYIEDDALASRRKAAAPRLDARRAAERRRVFAGGYDLYLILTVGILCAVGLLMVYSASIDMSYLATGDPGNTTYFFLRQVRSMVIGLVVLAILARLDYHIWRRLSIWMMLGVIVLLLAVLRFGNEQFQEYNTWRSITLFSLSFQPGELAKFTVVVYMAAWMASKRNRINNITYGIIPFSVLVGTVAFLIVLQPDLSTAASILATALSMFFIAGASWLQLLAIGGVMGLIGWQLIAQFAYARERLEAHAAAIEDLSQASEHVQQAVTAFLNGGLTGVGLGESRQKYSNNLPFPHTDSIFAVIGEELGLIGAFFVIALFALLIYRGFSITRRAPDTFGGLLAAGVTCWLAYDAMLNIAVMTALVPPTGVPLPFISYGGSSLVTALAGAGLILSVSRGASQQAPPRRQQTPEFSSADTERRNSRADHDISRRNRGRRVSRLSRRRGHS
jgi:cell division protein FtsW